MPENNEALLDLISQNIKLEKPKLTQEQSKNLAIDIKDIFESLNGGVMQLEDATENIISFCLNLLNQSENLYKSNNKLISSYDLITEKINDIIVDVSTKIKETNILSRQNNEIQDIVNKSSNYLSKLPDELIRNMENIFERSNILVTNSISQNISRTMDKIMNSFKSFETFMRDPLKMTRDNIFKNQENEDNNFLNLEKDNIINKKTLAGITDIPLSEQIVLYRTAPGIATMWLAKQLQKGDFISTRFEEEGGFISGTKDNLLQGMGIAGGMSTAALLPKILPLILNPWVLGSIAVALGGAMLWKFREPVGEFLNNIGESAGEWIENVKTSFKTKYEEIKNMFIEGWINDLERIKSSWNWVTEKWDSFASKVSNIYDENILPLLKDIDQLFGGIFSKGIEKIKELKIHLDDFSNWMSTIKENIQDFIITTGKNFLDWFRDFRDAITPTNLDTGGALGTNVGKDIEKILKENNNKPLPETKNSNTKFDISNINTTSQNINNVINDEMALEAAYSILKKAESGGNYGAVNRNDAGAVSLGTLQWNAGRAQSYLKRLYEVDPNMFSTIMGDKILSDLKNGDWSTRKFSRLESQNFEKLLEDPRMKAETDKYAMENISTYFKQARGLGIEDYKSLSLAASMINQYGYTGFKNLMEDRLQTTDFENMAQLFKEDRSFPYRDRRLREVEDLNNIYKEIKIVKEDLAKNINIPEALESYQQTTNSLIVNEVKNGLKGISENFIKSVDDLKTEVKDSKNKDDNKGMVDSSTIQSSRNNIDNIPKYIMEMIFGLNIGGEDKKFGGIF